MTTSRTTGLREELAGTIAFYDEGARDYGVLWDSYRPAALDRFVGMLAAGARVLNAGCGTGRDSLALTGAGRDPVGVDLSVGMVAHARSVGAEALCADMCALPFADAAFDGVWAHASLVHLDTAEARRALVELARVSAGGAPCFVNVKAHTDGPTCGWDGPRWFCYWQISELVTAAADTGWDVVDAYLRPDASRPDTSWCEAFLARR